MQINKTTPIYRLAMWWVAIQDGSPEAIFKHPSKLHRLTPSDNICMLIRQSVLGLMLLSMFSVIISMWLINILLIIDGHNQKDIIEIITYSFASIVLSGNSFTILNELPIHMIDSLYILVVFYFSSLFSFVILKFIPFVILVLCTIILLLGLVNGYKSIKEYFIPSSTILNITNQTWIQKSHTYQILKLYYQSVTQKFCIKVRFIDPPSKKPKQN